MNELERIIAELRAAYTAPIVERPSLLDFADRLAALAGAAPVAFPRVETGVVQFGDDWPGVFIRGDNAFAMAMHLRTGDSAWWSAAVESLAKLLESCNVANNPSVRVILTPVPHAPAKAREVTDADVEWALAEYHHGQGAKIDDHERRYMRAALATFAEDDERSKSGD